ncbi:MAG: hypothetical protein H6814_04360 [Phycisphaeraceae bacterium]|nr:hypothetical protein [Phycisphaeraceae bacterium]
MITFQGAADMLLQNAIAVIPIAIVVALLCRAFRLRPSTRHLLWLSVLVFLIIPPTLPQLSRSLLEARASDPAPASEQPAIPQPVIVQRSAQTPPAATGSKTGTLRIERTAAIAQRPTMLAAPHVTDGRFALQPEKPAIAEPLALPPRPIQHVPINPPQPLAQIEPEEQTELPAVIAAPAHNPLTTIAVFWESARRVCDFGVSRLRQEATSATSAASGYLRSAVNAVPRMPAWLWITGVVAVVAVAASRLWLACRLFKSAAPAPDSVRSLVEESAQELGLRRAPRSLMVSDRVSPMVWCGWRTTLVLPGALWSELDESGRRAVVQHELAHIRRRDHWVRWAEMLVATLYWWHPVVWWARRRVREEADLACDVWVTALMPGVRAPYARALLMTKQYVSAGGAGVPLVGIGAVSPGAKRFSRRITMVMTTRMNPRTSIVGVALAAMLVAGGVYSAPGWACPTPTAPEPDAAPAAPEAPSDLSTFEQYMIDRAPAPTKAPKPAKAPKAGAATSNSCGVAAPTGAGTACSPNVETTLGAIHGKLQALAGEHLGYAGGAGWYTVGDNAEREAVYHLPKDRLDALVKLMSRDDVPLLIQPLDDGVLVHGDNEQQRRFAAFVALLDPKKDRVEYRLTSQGKLKDLTSLMALGSVPTRVYIGDEDITVEGDTNTQRVFAEFVEMIDPGAAGGMPMPGQQGDNPMVRGMWENNPMGDEAAKVELRVRGMFQEAQRLREMQDSLQAQAEAIEAQADSIEAQSESHRAQAETILDQVEQWLEQAESLTTSEQYQAMVRAESAQHEADRMMQLAEMIESQVDMVLAQAEQMLEQADSFGEQADELEAQAEELAESLEEQLNELQDEMGDRIDQFHDWAHDHAESLHSLLEEHAQRLDEQLSQRFGSTTR